MRPLEGVILRLGVAVPNTLFLEKLGKLATFQSVGLEQRVALLDDAILLDQRRLAGVEVPDCILQLALELGDGLELVSDVKLRTRNDIP